MVERAEIYLMNLEPVIGSEQGRTRPVIILQNNFANKTSPTTIIAPLTSKVSKKNYPTIVKLPESFGLTKPSTILLNQLRTVDKRRIIKKLGTLSEPFMQQVNTAIKETLALN